MDQERVCIVRGAPKFTKTTKSFWNGGNVVVKVGGMRDE